MYGWQVFVIHMGLPFSMQVLHLHEKWFCPKYVFKPRWQPRCISVPHRFLWDFPTQFKSGLPNSAYPCIDLCAESPLNGKDKAHVGGRMPVHCLCIKGSILTSDCCNKLMMCTTYVFTEVNWEVLIHSCYLRPHLDIAYITGIGLLLTNFPLPFCYVVELIV